MKELWSPPAPVANVWKASKHRLAGESSAQYIEATPDATWEQINPFDFYRPPRQRLDPNERAPHEHFSKLADMALNILPSEEQSRLFRNSVIVLADLYGLLGLWREKYHFPHTPEEDVRALVLVVPDSVIERNGTLSAIERDEGKHLLENHLDERERRIYSERSDLGAPKKISLEDSVLLDPESLLFQLKSPGFMSSFLARPLAIGKSPDARIATYAEVRSEFGVRTVFDDRFEAGVSLVFTREPIDTWRRALFWFGQKPNISHLNSALEGVSPRMVIQDNEPASSWTCPSLLKALYLMLYVDIISGARLKKCQAPGCSEYFRVPPQSRDSLYCPPPPGEKQSKCASRASSRMYRERQRLKKQG